MRAIIAGGGTGGHIYPGLAIAAAIEEHYSQAEIIFLGSADGLEADIVPEAGYRLEVIPCQGLPREVSLKILQSILLSSVGFCQALKKVFSFKPDLVIGTGGYVSGPTILAAVLLRKKTIIHEQNAYPGLTNRLLASKVDKVALSNRAASHHFSDQADLVWTGNPVRPEILTARKEEACLELGLELEKPKLLAFGGSSGARSINQAMEALYPLAEEGQLQIIHITGHQDFERVKEVAQQLGITELERGDTIIKSYLHNMAAALAAADLVVCRAGATALAEITARGIPAILIPYPHAAENHQEHNARSLKKEGAAEVILDEELTGQKLASKVKELIFTEKKLASMAEASKKLGKPQALENILEILKELL
ncbi:undecaprenyldiphospho-muramoylpentapeptide beta-N-acetylglucosaminyltransferase [Fuchsiella alkaliacetigena]|uniref:undecaprenyldiphospho-muramoylpentapeptide beta-N-acetylglucosaminyltransferase n=1 Tax=Fuchsiella alkaliacetigena TaxID=957042 RepID=UPI00200AF0C2|nr:undecaprenyldiphospho-muramoylpentapeptide beta-N-acetylglucosaminyltransferase [Fuchsiella alkaliacetigena]MCK8823673.1 undecaprenyldiphospho-muramoylpentapeptide beta-N-acetylglucosaminyltransferase [Fuchsiella alkaliacetigena]